MVKTALHEAAQRGDTEKLKELFDEGIYDVNEESDQFGYTGVCREGERERWADSLFQFSRSFIVCNVDCVW